MNCPVFAPGTRVRSYDFPNRNDCYIEGVVLDVLGDRYEIAVERTVFEGRDITSTPGRIVSPPVNGLESFFGITCGVLAL